MSARGNKPAAVKTQPSEQALALADLALSLCFDAIPAPVLSHAKLIVRDTFGVMLAGSQLPEVRALARIAPSLAAGRAQIVGAPERAAAHMAALVNATGGVSLELDEGNQFAVNHPAVHILPGLWALAEERGASGANLLTAFVAGYEIAVSVGQATRLRDAVHPFGTHTIVGGAVGVARLLGLDRIATARTIEIAAGLPVASSQMAANSGASVRNLFTGFTNHNAVLAGHFAEAGFSGEPGAMSSVFGAILGTRFDLAPPDGFDTFYLTRNYFKIHACSRWNHAPIEAAAQLADDHGIDPREITSVTVHTYDPATRLGGTEVANAYAAKHSIAFNVAARLLYGSNDLEVYSDEVVQDTAMQSLIRKVRVVEDPELTALTPGIRAARVVIALGETLLEARSDVPLGGHDNPLDEAALSAKYHRLARLAIGDDAARDLEQKIGRLEEIERIGG